MLPPAAPEPPDRSIPAPIQATLVEPLAAASGRAGIDEELSREIEEDRRSTASATRVNASVESLSDKGEVVRKLEDEEGERKEKVVLDSHHKNGLEDQSAYL